MSRLDMSTEGGRLILHDLINFKKSGFSPFIENSHQSEEFWRSRDEYQEVSFPAFLQQAAKLAEIAIAQMPLRDRREEEARIARQKQPNKPKGNPTDIPTSSPPRQQNNSPRVQSLRSTIVAPYPNGERAIVIFELDGDIDERAFELQFAELGTKIKVYGRVPRELTNAAYLLGNTDTRNSIQDADCMLIDQVIQRRLTGSKMDENGNVWELREVINLPFECKMTLFNKHGKEIPTYLLRKNDQGYAWGYFWVVGKHVGKRDDGPTKIRCQATSDSESHDQSDDENNSNIDSSVEDYEEMSLEYESADDHDLTSDLNATINELKKSLEVQSSEQLRMTNDFEAKIRELQMHVDSKNEEYNQLKTTMQNEISSLAQQSQQQQTQMEAEKQKTLQYQNEKQELLDAVQKHGRRIEELQKKELQDEKRLEKQKQQIHQLQSQLDFQSTESDQVIHDNDRRIQELKELGRETVEKYEQQVHQLESRINIINNESDKEIQGKAQRIRELEEQISENDRLILENEKRIEELEQMGQKAVDEYQRQVHKLESQIKTMKDENDKAIKMKAEHIRELEEKAKNYELLLTTTNERIQELEGQCMERDQQCVYQMDQIERLTKQVNEFEKCIMEKDQQLNFHLKHIGGLKTHVQQQQEHIKHLKKAGNVHQKVEGKISFTKITDMNEEQENVFGDFDQWESDESMPVSFQFESTFPNEHDDSKSPDGRQLEESKSGEDGKNDEAKSDEDGRNDESKSGEDEPAEICSTTGTRAQEDNNVHDKGSGFAVADDELSTNGSFGIEDSCTQNQEDTRIHVGRVVEDSTIRSFKGEDASDRDQESSQQCQKQLITNDNGSYSCDNNGNDCVQKKENAVVEILQEQEVLAVQGSKKRKSVACLEEEQPNKKLRKSRRLEEKRLARQMKAKID